MANKYLPQQAMFWEPRPVPKVEPVKPRLAPKRVDQPACWVEVKRSIDPLIFCDFKEDAANE